MPKLPQISGQELGRKIFRLGFVLKSRKGSHMKFMRVFGERKEIIIIPNHKILRKGTLHDILKQLNLDIKKLKELL